MSYNKHKEASDALDMVNILLCSRSQYEYEYLAMLQWSESIVGKDRLLLVASRRGSSLRLDSRTRLFLLII